MYPSLWKTLDFQDFQQSFPHEFSVNSGPFELEAAWWTFGDPDGFFHTKNAEISRCTMPASKCIQPLLNQVSLNALEILWTRKCLRPLGTISDLSIN